ncbi:hypothetical protein D910_03664 [Dendroctonus ponderosae]|uniref:RNA helicase aquarius n=1 Tax=Dendroctonus ponderosae TaxID=77166 RepID=U4TXC0_DENPD|nr:hypothetical protein D910_03664 [Dendroctonus ponderosae]
MPLQLLEMLKFYTRFEISDETGDPLSDHDMTQLHYIKITSLQKAAFAKFPELRAFSLANVANVDTRKALEKHFGPLSCDQLKAIATYLCLVPPAGQEENYKWCRLDESFLRELLTGVDIRNQARYRRCCEQAVSLSHLVNVCEFVVDYRKAEDGSTYWGGWARMAHPIEHFAVVEVAKPNIGETRPSRVRADVTVNLSVKSEVKVEWENLRKHDVCFLVTVKPLNPIGTRYNYKEPFVPQVGLRCVRGCEIEGMLDSNGRVIEDGPDPKPVLPGDRRTFRVWLDCNQYREDMSEANKGKDDVYEGFNIIIRRKPKENNFKAVLETIRELMNTECVVPEWLHNIILGYGDPSAAHYEKMEGQISTLDYNDTFIDADHLRSCFPEYQIKIKTDDPKKLVRPFRLTFENLGSQPAEEKAKIIVVEPHKIDRRGPFLFNEPKKNIIPFTPSQVEAIKSGMQPGLTLVVGPPGTGKTDVAVQIISNLYHNFPNQRTLIVTHSNQALNQLFDKIVGLDIDERHLLRLGHGEEALETEKDFSRYGRVNYVLAKRIDLLNEVQKLQESLDVEGDQAYTCETAGYFYLYQILSRWEHFQSIVKPKSGNGVPVEAISKEFPFHRFFNNAPQPLFQGVSYEADLEVAESCFRYIDHIFKELEEFRAFELLRSGLDRSKYLLVKEAKIIAMTCTHAALKRKELVEIGFKYDNILMEESAQILEIETFIPLLLQNPQDGYNRLKRWIMIGDHHQLPPVIKNMAFQKYSNMEQSLFTRLVRLGVPTVDLDGQGRARPSICNLYKWRYKQLGNLGHVENWPEYKRANAGFAFDFQLIDVQDFNGVGESEPNPYFYQNLAEAEYCVAVFMFMRLIGYPASKITILTTYNGQKHLIRDVINARCAKNPLIGRPHKVTTVDKYQGQQNDYILLSLVKTNAVGHLRDVRRLVVAMSRARLGLYIFARVALFQNCFELTPAFEQLTTRPTKLHLVLNELYPTHRLSNEKPDNQIMVVEDMTHIANFVYQYYMERVKVMRTQYERIFLWVVLFQIAVTATVYLISTKTRKYRPVKPAQLYPSGETRLLDFTDFHYTINKPTKCGSANLLLLVLVSSAPENTEYRNAIRQSWGRNNKEIKLLFTLGKTDDIKQTSLDNEDAKYGDIIQGNFIDSYKNLTYKSVMALNYAVNNCPQAKFIMKCDDDVFVNMSLLKEFLKAHTHANSTLFCNVNENMLPVRDPNSTYGKWYVSQEDWPEEIYPNYCSGWYTILTYDAALFLYAKAQTTKFFWIDDVFLTGIVARQIPWLHHTNLEKYTLVDTVELKDAMKKHLEGVPFLFGIDTQKQFQEPGSLEQKSHDGLIASHPGEERDTDSEDEQEATGQLPIPIQDEVQPPKESPMEIIPVEQPDDDMKDETTASETMDTGEVANDE